MQSITPLRYPGGKSKFYSIVKEVIINNHFENKTYTEPFAGSFGIGLHLLLDGVVKSVIINDYDYHIYAFWRSVFYQTKKLIEKIAKTDITISEWIKQKEIFKNYTSYSILDVGFATLFLNRTNYSGILKGGPIGGIEQKGNYKIDCRFNKEKLIKLIKTIASYKNCVKIYNNDAKNLIRKLNSQEDKIFYNFDPPYVVKGKDLYINFYKEKDHEELKTYIEKISSPWIMTYDNTQFIRKLYSDYVIKEISLNYSVRSHKLGNEVLISNFIAKK